MGRQRKKNGLRTDANGGAIFIVTALDMLLKDWENVEAGPEGDPKLIENMHVALTGDPKEPGCLR